jgi:predicted Zn-dependent protease
MPRRQRSVAVRRAVALALLMALPACATNPATGRRQLMLISESQEIQMGREADKEIEGAFGIYPDAEVQAYVARLGAELAASSERKDLPWTFRVVDDPTVNAFALPGGFIYVTRGLMTHLNSEAELVSVLGHEIGHVTARHTAAMLSKQQFAMLGLGVGMIVRPELQQFGQLAQAGVGLMFLKFGRDAERQADDLGLRYLDRLDYDPQEAVQVFSVLERASQREGEGGRLPSWLSTHPAPEDRAQRLQAAITSGRLSGDKIDRDEYLDQIDGMVFGENPREGFFVQNAFYHPDLRFSLRFPQGWKADNQRQAVGAVSPNQDALVVMSLERHASADQAAQEFFRQQGVRPAQTQRTSINGKRAVSGVFEAVSGQALLAGRVAFIEHDGKVYRILGYTPQARWRSYDRVFAEAIASFDDVTERRYLDVQPQRIDIVELGGATPVASFASRNATPVSADVLALINGVAVGGMLPAGQDVKTVVGPRLPGDDRNALPARPARRR